MTEKILCVDDEPNILEGYQRSLRKRFQIDIAIGGEQGLAEIDRQGPYAVVISDLRMPGMDGVQFLAKVRDRSPDSIRVMLTGQADMNSAIGAVNEGRIFRFLTKPCPPDILSQTLQAGLEQYRLTTMERDLLEKTLSGTIKVLIEILSLVNPTAFSRSSRLRRYMRHMAVQLDLPNVWEFEMASMLSQIGCVTVPPDILDKVYTGQELLPDEKGIVISHPMIGAKLLAKIPRLEAVAQMVEGQAKSSGPFPLATDLKSVERTVLGAQMLRVALDFDHWVARGTSHRFAVNALRNRPDGYSPALLATLDTLEVEEPEREVRRVHVHEINTRMILNEDVRSKTGLLLLAKGQEVTDPMIGRLRSIARTAGVIEPFSVLVPRQTPLQESPRRKNKEGGL